MPTIEREYADYDLSAYGPNNGGQTLIGNDAWDDAFSFYDGTVETSLAIEKANFAEADLKAMWRKYWN